MTTQTIREETERYGKYCADFYYKHTAWPNIEQNAEYWLKRIQERDAELAESAFKLGYDQGVKWQLDWEYLRDDEKERLITSLTTFIRERDTDK